MENKAKEITLVPIKDIKLNPRNRNKHPKDQIERLSQIISYQGFRTPVTISNRTSMLVAGHGRLLAAKSLGIKDVPVIYQDFDNEEQEIAHGISDNAIGLWSELDLSGINTDIPDLGPDFDIDMLGIKNFTIDISEKEGLCDEDEVPEAPMEPITKLGDIYKLGNHRLMCGDSTSVIAIESLTNGENIDLLFTDPPYGMSIVKANGMVGGERVGKNAWANSERFVAKAKTGTYKPIIGDDEPFEPQYLLTIASDQIIWGANHFSEKLPTSPHWLVWNKKMPKGSDFSGAELAWTSIDRLSVKVYDFTWAGMTRQGDRKDELSKRVHPTQKPVGLFVDILNDYEPKSVIDLYGGSGSTLIACEKTNRKCFMMELDPHYVDVIVSRWEKYTGQKAELLNG